MPRRWRGGYKTAPRPAPGRQGRRRCLPMVTPSARWACRESPTVESTPTNVIPTPCRRQARNLRPLSGSGRASGDHSFRFFLAALVRMTLLSETTVEIGAWLCSCNTDWSSDPTPPVEGPDSKPGAPGERTQLDRPVVTAVRTVGPVVAHQEALAAVEPPLSV